MNRGMLRANDYSTLAIIVKNSARYGSVRTLMIVHVDRPLFLICLFGLLFMALPELCSPSMNHCPHEERNQLSSTFGDKPLVYFRAQRLLEGPVT